MTKRVPRGEEEQGLTEWFEQPEQELSREEYAYHKACRKMGVDRKPKDKEQAAVFHQLYMAAISEKWITYNGMDKAELAVRLNEASKMVEPENQKFLPQDVQERTGLEMNPLWMMECMVRSGALRPQQQVAALKTLAEYTHSKTPSFSAHASAELSAEEWLKALAADQYEVVDVDDEPVQRVERPKRADNVILHQKRGRPSKGVLAQREARANLDIDLDAVDAEYEEIIANARETSNGSGTEEAT